MKAVVFHEHGGPDRLHYEDIAQPCIASQEVLIRVKACALNHLDLWIRQGTPAYHLTFPHISGCDVAGIIEEVGIEVTGLSAGDRVFLSPGVSCWCCEQCLSGRDNQCPSYKIIGAQVDGGYAELVKAPGVNAIPIPGALTFGQAAAFPLVSVTAWHMLFALAGLKPGEWVLVMGAGSGVGSMAIQMAKLAGARVVTTVGAGEKVPKAKAIGADEVINYTEEDLTKRVKMLTEGRGVDVVIEHIGPDVWDKCLASLAKGGRLVTCGATTGGEVKLDLRFLFSRQLTVKGSYMGTRAELLQAAALMGQGKLRAIIDQTFPLQEARAAQERMRNRQGFGKIVLTV